MEMDDAWTAIELSQRQSQICLLFSAIWGHVGMVCRGHSLLTFSYFVLQ